jgi:hypothetical protein
MKAVVQTVGVVTWDEVLKVASISDGALAAQELRVSRGFCVALAVTPRA